jgi:signal transduction histidine kinase
MTADQIMAYITAQHPVRRDLATRILEALQNTAKYAHASQARICLQAANGILNFTVSDDGSGYDTRRTPTGSGLRNMADRLAALGGRLEVRSVPGQGTTITGHLPIASTGCGH